MPKKTTVLLLNLGTPKSPNVSDVRSYLFEFLNDRRVIDIPWLLRKILVNLIIVPFRAKESSKIYKKLWTKQGSPLMIYGEKVKELLQAELQENFKVELAMRYQQPSMNKVLEKIRKDIPEKLIILPMYPHYASSTTGSTLEKTMEIIKTWEVIPEIKFVKQFFDHDGFLNTIVDKAQKYDLNKFDHFVFSYHGLPVRQINKVHPDRNCLDCKCHEQYDRSTDYFCYRATCFETSRLLAKKLNIPKEKYTVAFQSRLNKNWLEPFSDKIVTEQAKNGSKNLLIFSPAFVADCLETTVEIGIEYRELFKKNGGEKLVLVESLNDHPKWIQCLKDLVINS
ncbi:ferrochelatase [Ancylomarina longa]|uniref:Ferrochelatase n=1 Tax=Ancylomarina longa TaxID=2487017 RepID=A0A434AU71_9BACT|nr:ferrochelatase [Ancylomarina longa]RUT77916.1 ferrochelatase [Ancylomarina longa]